MLASGMSLIVKNYLYRNIFLRFIYRLMTSVVGKTVVNDESIGFVESGNKSDYTRRHEKN